MTVTRSAHHWRAGVIAAGRGERLCTAGTRPKPLVAVGDRTLVECVLGSLAEASPSEVVIIINEASTSVIDHVACRQWPFPIRWIVETTRSSMHSFLRVVETLHADGDDGPFLISTVDTVAAPGAFEAFRAACSSIDADVVLAVTPPSTDEKPLLVEIGADGRTITRIGRAVSAIPAGRASAARHGSRKGSIGEALEIMATAGYYAVRASVLREADRARRDDVGALRMFFERLLEAGYRFGAVRVADGIDVDTPSDVRAAESFLRQVES